MLIAEHRDTLLDALVRMLRATDPDRDDESADLPVDTSPTGLLALRACLPELATTLHLCGVGLTPVQGTAVVAAVRLVPQLPLPPDRSAADDAVVARLLGADLADARIEAGPPSAPLPDLGWEELGAALAARASAALPRLAPVEASIVEARALDVARAATLAAAEQDHWTCARLLRWLPFVDQRDAGLILPLLEYQRIYAGCDPTVAWSLAVVDHLLDRAALSADVALGGVPA
ncbi:MAG: hypothetical protein IR158_12500 [Cellulomonas sp.]|uniref:hypothetical protein n=1 Tax=Cellulomonas sp. TaxID=40001 RepID=UPI0019E97659|nr:hypothetical protein [Cellulomonas sp.]MBF0688569.1 hypothetical protein [Cellulomonas sp.]